MTRDPMESFLNEDYSVDRANIVGTGRGERRRRPTAVMLIDERDRTLTFAEYRDACERAAAGFYAQGVRGGDTISWQIPTWIETLVLMAALSRLGVRQVPLLPIYRERELTFCLRQAGAKTLYVPGTWRGFDYVALAERVRERIGQFDIAVLDHVLPDGDPTILPPPPSPEDATRCDGCTTPRAPRRIRKARSTRTTRRSRQASRSTMPKARGPTTGTGWLSRSPMSAAWAISARYSTPDSAS